MVFKSCHIVGFSFPAVVTIKKCWFFLVLHWYHRVQGLNPIRLSLRKFIICIFNCDDLDPFYLFLHSMVLLIPYYGKLTMHFINAILKKSR